MCYDYVMHITRLIAVMYTSESNYVHTGLWFEVEKGLLEEFEIEKQEIVS